MSTNSVSKTSYILALDQGTTSSRALLFDKKSQVVGQAKQTFEQIFPQTGWVEHDPMEIWSSQRSALTQVLERNSIKPQQIQAIGITNQRETIVVWNKETGQPIYNAIVWQCRRTASTCERLQNQGHADKIRSKTGLYLDPYFSASKIQWILDHVENARTMADQGLLLCGTIDSWLIWKLTQGRVHVTDPTNASRTMLYNIHERQWDDELLAMFQVPRSMLPTVKSSSMFLGHAQVGGYEIPITGVAGDQQASLFGQQCFEEGHAKNTYGTGCFLLMNTGKKPVSSNYGLLTTLALDQQGEVNYALEGSVFMGGATVQWLRDELGFLRDENDSAYFASKVESNEGVYLVPAFTGLGAPYWDPQAKGSITGLTRGSNRNHLIRAALESIAYQSYDVLQAMQKDANIQL
jgi:glycerol kinase